MFTLNLLKFSINSVRLNQRHISVGAGRHLGIFKSEKVDDETPINMINDEVDEYDQHEQFKRIEQLRDISKLSKAHRRMLNGETPYRNSESWVHETLKYKRRLYGKLGSASNVDPSKKFLSTNNRSELNLDVYFQEFAFGQKLS